MLNTLKDYASLALKRSEEDLTSGGLTQEFSEMENCVGPFTPVSYNIDALKVLSRQELLKQDQVVFFPTKTYY